MTATMQLAPVVPLLSMIVKPPPPGLRFDKRKDGWEPVKGVDLPPLDSEFTIELVEFLKGKEEFVSGAVMCKRAIKLGNCADQRHAERMLENTEDIPIEFRDFCLVFPETSWLTPHGRLCVPNLFCHDIIWSFGFGWLNKGGWGSYCRLVRLRQHR